MGAITRLKRFVGNGEPDDYVCRRCGTAYAVQHYTCPDCGSYSVERPVDLDLE